MLGKIKLAVLSLVMCSPVFAGQYITAKVVSIEPVYRSFAESTPHRVCHNVSVPIQQTNQGNVLTNMIIGGLIGGTTTNSDRGAAAGAVIGGLLTQNNTTTGYTTQQRCETQYTNTYVNKITGYVVTAKYGNETITLTMNSRPGNTITLYQETTYTFN